MKDLYLCSVWSFLFIPSTIALWKEKEHFFFFFFVEYRIATISTCEIRTRFPWLLRHIHWNSTITRRRPLLLPRVKYLPVSVTHCGSCFEFRYNKTWSMVKPQDLTCQIKSVKIAKKIECPSSKKDSKTCANLLHSVIKK